MGCGDWERAMDRMERSQTKLRIKTSENKDKYRYGKALMKNRWGNEGLRRGRGVNNLSGIRLRILAVMVNEGNEGKCRM